MNITLAIHIVKSAQSDRTSILALSVALAQKRGEDRLVHESLIDCLREHGLRILVVGQRKTDDSVIDVPDSFGCTNRNVLHNQLTIAELKRGRISKKAMRKEDPAENVSKNFLFFPSKDLL
jgi:hypothetical protein